MHSVTMFFSMPLNNPFIVQIGIILFHQPLSVLSIFQLPLDSNNMEDMEVGSSETQMVGCYLLSMQYR